MNWLTRPLFSRGGWFRRALPFIFCLLLSSFCLLFLAGCARSEQRADIVIVNNIEPESLDPAIIVGVAEMRIVSVIFEGLARLDPKTANPVPGLAESWEISPDGLVYTFHLRSNLVWSTGGPITADDVVYSWIRALDPATASDYAGQLYYVKNGEEFNAGKIKDPSLVGVHALDARTVRVELNHPTAFFLDLCAFPTLSVVPRQTIEKYGDRWLMTRPLPVSGPYELEDWRINDKVRVRKNPRYWDAANTKTEVVDFLPIGSPTTALNLYETGGADIVWDKDLVPIELLDLLLKRPDFHTYPILGAYYVSFNITRKPFDDVRVRQALGLAIDKERITKKITKAGEQPAYSFTPPGINRYHAPQVHLGYDPEKARRLLAEAGYPGGKGFPRFQYTYNASAGGAGKINADIAVELQQMWRDELGIDMEARQMEWKVYLAARSKLDYDVSRASWFADYNDADTFLNLFVSDNGNNQTGWSSARYDQLIRDADHQNDPARREKLFQEAETMLVDEVTPVVPLFFYVGFNYYHPDEIKGIYPNLIDMHPVNWISKSSRESKVESRGP